MPGFKFKKGLGRGLSSLIGDSTKEIHSSVASINDLSRNKFQPRKSFNKEDLLDLTNSIKESGVIQPIVVRPDKSSDAKYEIIAGERRWLASQNAGLHEVPIVVLDIDDEKSLEFAIVENVQRQNLNAIEEAEGYKKLIDEFGYNQDKVSKFIGKSRSYITNALRILTLPSKVISYVVEGHLTAGHARSLVGLENAEKIAQEFLEKKISVRQAENYVKSFKEKKLSNKYDKKDINIVALEKTIEDKTGLNTYIHNKKNNSGRISISYKKIDQLERLISIIKSNY